MKKILYLSSLASLLFAFCTPAYHATVAVPQQPQVQQVQYPEREEASFQVFYDQLGAYGRWFDYPGEGYVWSPNAGTDFQPYSTDGNWVYSDQGWTWASDYSWGWAPFHYGRWFYEDGYGWLWLPGHEWAPAWVTWGQSGSYYGWAPLGPHIRANQQWTPPQRSWTFVPAEHINKPHVAQYAADRSTNNTIIKNVNIINNTTVINRNVTNNTVINNNVTNNNQHVTNNVNNEHVNNNIVNNNEHLNTNINNEHPNTNINNEHVNNNVANNNVINNNNNNPAKNNTDNTSPNSHPVNNPTYINKGPQVNEVEKVLNTHITQVPINENNKPAQTQMVNNRLMMYRPAIRENGVEKNGGRPVPQKIEQFRPANNNMQGARRP